MPGVGDVIGGKYRLEALVGSGGMGLVYAATHLSLAQAVALKIVRHDPNETGTVRLIREARVVGSLKSEHVARVQDVGVMADGSPYLVMELLEGATLDALVRRDGACSVEEATEYVIHACHALGEAHALGIVHRDVKPSNLFRTLDSAGQPRLKVIDFGISRLRASADLAAAPTRTGTLLGSPPFMSPEQILEAKDVDARSDVWSLGVVLYFLLTAELPFQASSLLELMTRIAYEEPTPVSADLPAGLLAIVARCMAKQRGDRFTSAAELASALVPYAPARARSVAERVVRDVAAPVAEPKELRPGTREDDSTVREVPRPPGPFADTADASVQTASLHETLPSPRRRGLAAVLSIGLLATIVAVALAGGRFREAATAEVVPVVPIASSSAALPGEPPVTEVPLAATTETAPDASVIAHGSIDSARHVVTPRGAPHPPSASPARSKSNRAKTEPAASTPAPVRAASPPSPARPDLPTTPD